MNELAKMMIVLGTILVVSIATLTYVNQFTQPMIKENMQDKALAGLKTVFPEADNFVQSADKVHTAYSNGEIIGYVVETSEYGYSSDIRLLVGIKPDNTLKSVFVLEQQETPGLGSRIVEDNFIRQFDGQNKGLKLSKDGGTIDGITSATISSEAVLRAVEKAHEILGE
ncbi:RnfABCDGE type electron transport complex subunit G [Candidatus Woesearchaeota archaeon]|nr:RnfABCDGE type electron transport complex subunit G [Candidatus Woesearchaeota archaeon]